MASRIYTEADTFTDESSKLYIGKVFTAGGFRAWLRAQRRTRYIKWHVIHHTWVPETSEPDMGTVSRGIFDWYSEHWGFQWGRFCHTMTGTQQGQPVIFVGTHPDWQGIHAAHRNANALGTENYGNGQKRPFPDWQLELLWQIMLGYEEWAGVPTAYVGYSDGPGNLFHRDCPDAGKDCPGLPYNTADYMWAKFAQMGDDMYSEKDRERDAYTAVRVLATNFDVKILDAEFKGRPEWAEYYRKVKLRDVRNERIALGLLQGAPDTTEIPEPTSPF